MRVWGGYRPSRALEMALRRFSGDFGLLGCVRDHCRDGRCPDLAPALLDRGWTLSGPYLDRISTVLGRISIVDWTEEAKLLQVRPAIFSSSSQAPPCSSHERGSFGCRRRRAVLSVVSQGWYG